ncbi:WxL domain-containing protein [Vagococcus fluvialis]|uniref:WxL domain-containing protein n=1 Tax=Vagococcus fluvialis TaxID=2738 RepID=UPI001A904F2D|nr:WxL domain-containing protein [Vagococcus fluvialis]MBO0437449.1 WxL domain-containing protein [Vagococcus fluvialis]
MKKILGTTLIGMSGIIMFSGIALAAEETGFEPTKNYNSDLSIKFEAENPNQGTGPYKDRLSFTWAPKSFQFGKQLASFEDKVEYKLDSAAAGKQWVVVNDDRGENIPNAGATWNVKVVMDDIKEITTNENPQKLAGTLNIALDEVKQYHIGTKSNENNTDIDPADPNTAGVVTEFDKKPTDILLGNETTALTGTSIELVPGTETPVMNQNKARTEIVKEGYATRLADSTIKFTGLTSDVVGKEFGTTLTWTLTRDVK